MMEKLKLGDVECSICFGTLFEPVTLPCNHDFCLKCIEGNVRDASLKCPLCRRRFGSWLRKNKSFKHLVNKEKWDRIKTAFPERIQCIVEGIPEPMDSFIESPKTVSSPGSIKKEFEQLLEHHKKESEQEMLQENEASMALIKKLMANNEISPISTEEVKENDSTRCSIPDIEINETSNSRRRGSALTPKSIKRKSKRALSFELSNGKKKNCDSKVHQTTITSAFRGSSRYSNNSGLLAGSSSVPCRSSSPEYELSSAKCVPLVETKNLLGIADDEYEKLIKEQKKVEAIIEQEIKDFAFASKLQSQLDSTLQTRKKRTIEGYYKKSNRGVDSH